MNLHADLKNRTDRPAAHLLRGAIAGVVALSLSFAPIAGAASANPLLGTWRGIDRSDPNIAVVQTTTYKADGTYEANTVLSSDHTGQFFYANGYYRIDAPGAMTFSVSTASICVAGQGPSSCLPNRAATNLGVPTQARFSVDGQDQMTLGNIVFRRVQ